MCSIGTSRRLGDGLENGRIGGKAQETEMVSNSVDQRARLAGGPFLDGRSQVIASEDMVEAIVSVYRIDGCEKRVVRKVLSNRRVVYDGFDAERRKFCFVTNA